MTIFFNSSLRSFQERYIFLPLIFCPQTFFLWNPKLKHSYKKYNVNASRNLQLNQVYYSQAISHHPWIPCHSCVPGSKNLLPLVHPHLLFLMAVICLSPFHARELFPQIFACPLLWDSSIIQLPGLLCSSRTTHHKQQTTHVIHYLIIHLLKWAGHPL